MTKTVPALLLLALLSLTSSGCLGLPRQEATLPDPSIGHRVASEAVVSVWVRKPDGALTTESVRLLPGWYIFSPEILVAPETNNQPEPTP